jgi:antitoxin component YwqK of YwqJK toxin-antitoxin module
MSRYFKLDKYIFEIELTENSKPIKYAENRSGINELNATYDTTEFKIIDIEDMVTKEKLTSYDKYTINNTYKTERKYYKSYDRAFQLGLWKNEDYLFFENGYTGNIKIYYFNGRLSKEFYIVNNKINGLYNKFDEDENLIEEKYYVDGKLHGICKKYNEEGILIQECNYNDDKLNGLYKEYNEEGILIKECNYNDGKLNGICKEYNKNIIKLSFDKNNYVGITNENIDKIAKYIKSILSG